MNDIKSIKIDAETALKLLLEDYIENQNKGPSKQQGAEDLLENLGKTIKRLRQAQDISQRQLSALAGLSIGPVLQLEKGLKTVSLENAEKILGVLGKKLVIR